MAQEKKIRILKDGPYHVKGGVRLVREQLVKEPGPSYKWKGREVLAEGKESYYLCRCGASKKMPYCDGSHHKIGFKGTETAGEETYAEMAFPRKGEKTILYDQLDLCSLSRFCNGRYGKVWNLLKEDMDPEKREEIIRGAMECPSGRLVAVDALSGKAYEPEFSEVEIAVTQDLDKECSGPLIIRGKIPIESEEGFCYEERNRVALCRCGHSHNKPFCDARHLPTDFRDADLEKDLKNYKDDTNQLNNQ